MIFEDMMHYTMVKTTLFNGGAPIRPLRSGVSGKSNWSGVLITVEGRLS